MKHSLRRTSGFIRMGKMNVSNMRIFGGTNER